MTNRLENRLSTVEGKIAGSDPDNAVRLYFVKGYPTEGAGELLRAHGRDLSRPHAIVAFVTKPIVTPLVDITDEMQRAP